MSKRERTRWESSDDEVDEHKRQIERNVKPKKRRASVLSIAEVIAQEKNEAKKEVSKVKYNPLINGCRSVYDCYERLDRIDEGTYGVVWEARDYESNHIFALKQIKFDVAFGKEGFPVTALREINVLLALSHENIVTVREMVVGDSFDKVFMVMEKMEFDLADAMKRNSDPFPQGELKSILYQIFSAVDHVHGKWFLHRDLKTSNILVHRSGKVALCDFGLARKYQIPYKASTQMVITLWYRPPELLFGETVYGPEVDLWSLGCIFGELLTKSPILQGQGELDQIDKIIKLVGVPNEEEWPEFSRLPNANLIRFKKSTEDYQSAIQNRFPVNSFSRTNQSFLDGNGFNLLQSLLTLSPKKRISASSALNHEYFKQGVPMSQPQFNFDP